MVRKTPRLRPRHKPKTTQIAGYVSRLRRFLLLFLVMLSAGKHLWIFSSDAVESYEQRFFASLRNTETLFPSSAAAEQAASDFADLSHCSSHALRV